MTKAIGFLFPGQGAQFLGMGKDLFEQSPAARQVYEKADRILGYSISQICFAGPETELMRTLYAQTGILVTSLAALAAIRERMPGLQPSLVAGLSLGEFTALTASEAISFEDALKLVQVRAEAMENAAKNHPGTMASVMGLDLEQCKAVAQEARCEVANLNTPDQTVLSGTFPAIEQACKIAEAKGAKRALPLSKSVALSTPPLWAKPKNASRQHSQKRPSASLSVPSFPMSQPSPFPIPMKYEPFSLSSSPVRFNGLGRWQRPRNPGSRLILRSVRERSSKAWPENANPNLKFFHLAR